MERSRNRNDRKGLEQETRLLDLSRRAVERAQDLAATNVGSQSQLDQAKQDEALQQLSLDARRLAIVEFDYHLAQYQAKLVRAQALRDQAKLDLSRAEVKAPFAGRIAEVLVAPGDRARVGDELVRIYDTSAMEIRAQVPIRHLPDIRQSLAQGTKLLATTQVDRLPLDAVLDRLGGEIAPGSGGVDGLFRVVDNGEWLQLGRTVELIMRLPEQADVVVLPPEAIYGTDRIFKLENQRMSGVRVERVGEIRDETGRNRILVTSPELKTGDRVVVTQLPNAIDGLRVRVAEN